jgi:uncharacterized protein YcaQ
MKRIALTALQARKIILHAAGLSKRAQFGKGREAVYKLIDHLGFIQIDTNYIVERAHHHSIASRVPDYKPEWLEELQADERIFEFLTYASGYMPMDDFRFSLPVKAAFLARRKPMASAEINLMNKVLDRISRDGPLMAKDFENDRVEASSGWWDWRPSKVALERLYMDGSLMVTRTKEFHKVYDLPVNILPGDIEMTMPTPEAFARQVIRRALKALGVAYVKDISFRARFVQGHLVKTELEKLVAEGEVLSVEINGLKTAPLYMLASYRNKTINLAGDAFILSPFDVLNVYRHRLRDFFNFDYQVECFVPAARRKYGYFSLPVLVGDTFVARMDAKADRKNRVLIILNLHVEPAKMTQPMIAKVSEAIEAFAVFNQCFAITVQKTNLKVLGKAIKKTI